ENLVFILFMALSMSASAKEIALSFDDAPVENTVTSESLTRTKNLIRKLKALKIPPVIIYANACKREDTTSVIQQLKLYRNAGHHLGNHTCSHPDLDQVGYADFSQDAATGDRLLAPLLSSHRFFRYPFLHEGTDAGVRDQMRAWLVQNHYRNGTVSIEDGDYVFSYYLNLAKAQGKKTDYAKVRALFVKHVLGAVEFYDNLAIKNLGYSPRHVLLLHEMDATVMFLDSVVHELRHRGWKITATEKAYQDKMYFESPKNTFSDNGFVAQLTYEKTGIKYGYDQLDADTAELIRILGL
ncbi:MAG: polysaccharide deacetylase family protein, partial [Bdellovibrionales bacterium]